jgi:hypothetical protein
MLELLMSKMESDLGAERFRQFWKSDLPIPDAFAAARGEPLEVWLRRQVIGTTAPYRAGPLPSATVLLVTIVMSVALMMIGVYAVGNRARF